MVDVVPEITGLLFKYNSFVISLKLLNNSIPEPLISAGYPFSDKSYHILLFKSIEYPSYHPFIKLLFAEHNRGSS